MQNHQNASNPQSTSRSFLSNQFDYLFDDGEDKALVDCLARYIITGDHLITTPALWQDVAIFIRYKKRDVWSLSDEQLDNAKRAIFIYRVKYITEHLSKQDIVKCLNKFYSQRNDPHYDPNYRNPASRYFNQKLHAPVDSLFLTQEKLIIDKPDLKNFDKLFAYPCWIEFTVAAIDQITDQILANKLTDEQIDYFLGAADDTKNYNKWFKVTKYILQTTNDPHVFYTAGDILAIIRRAVPSDAKSQKWFNDQLFEIFWPRVGSIWPLQHEELINEGATEILTDSISWLHTISDIKDRLEELDDDFIMIDFNTDDADFKAQKSALYKIIQDKACNPTGALDLFFDLAYIATSPETTKELREFAETEFIPFIKTTEVGTKTVISLINKAVKHAETYQQTLARERQNLAKLIK